MTRIGRLKRRLDRRYYRAMYAFIRAVLPTEVSAAPIDGSTLRRILVLPNYKVGDLMVALPAIAYLRDVAPAARLDVLVSDRNASLLAGDPRVDRVLIHNEPHDSWLATTRRLRRERYDLVVDFVLPRHLHEGLLTALVAGRTGARLTSYRPAGFWGFFTHLPRIPGFERQYMADRLLYAARAAVHDPSGRTGRESYPLALTVEPAAAARVDAFLGTHVTGDFVALNAWASDTLRTLAPAQVAAVAAALVHRYPHLCVVLTPPPHAADAARAIVADAIALLTHDIDAAHAADGPDRALHIVVFPPSRHLPDLVALLARARVVFTPDTANIHLAAALARPLVALFTTLTTHRVAHWIPQGVPHRTVVDTSARPLAALPVAPMLEAFDALWRELHGSPTATVTTPSAALPESADATAAAERGP